MKLALIVADATGAMHAGLDVERTVKLFDMPADMQQFIENNRAAYVTFSLAMAPDAAAALADKGE